MYYPLAMSLSSILMEDLHETPHSAHNMISIEMSAVFSWFANNKFLTRDELDKLKEYVSHTKPDDYESLYKFMCKGVFFSDNDRFERIERDFMTVGIYLEHNTSMNEEDVHRLMQKIINNQKEQLDEAKQELHELESEDKDVDFVIEVKE